MTSQHRQLGGIKNLKFLIFIFRCAHGATFTPGPNLIKALGAYLGA